jgi:hypothetical protein
MYKIISTGFIKILRYKIHENLSNDSKAVPCGQTDGQT